MRLPDKHLVGGVIEKGAGGYEAGGIRKGQSVKEFLQGLDRKEANSVKISSLLRQISAAVLSRCAICTGRIRR